MKPGKGRWLAVRPLRSAAVLFACALFTGCAVGRANVEKKLMAEKAPVTQEGVTEQYRVGCPDVLEIRVDERPEFTAKHVIDAGGRIDLGDYGKLRVEGKTLTEIAKLLAEETGSRPEAIHVRVLEYRSQFVLLFGQVIGWQRSVPYQGQETVLDLLQRVGGITPGAQPENVHVVRVHLGGSQRTEVFHVDLNAIVAKHDPRTNIRLLPFDQIYVGETRQNRVEKSFPPWLRPAYQAFWRMLPKPNNVGTPGDEPPLSRWIAGLRDVAGTGGEEE
jgi:polysaccharide export outer membrane protein